MHTGKIFSGLLLVAVCMFYSARARAEEADSGPPPKAQWYGWEYAAADASGAALLVYACTESTAPLLESVFYDNGRKHLLGSEWTSSPGAIGSGLYLGGAPFAHLLNGHPANAAASLGARIFVPFLMVQLVEPIGGTVGFFVRDSHGQAAR